jgi:hypothetical protein
VSKHKTESRKQKAEMKSGRLPEQFRNRTKSFAAQIIRLFDPTLTKPLENEASELMAIFTTMINRTKDGE